MPPPGDAHGGRGRRPVERLGGRGPPVGQEEVLGLVGQAEPADVHRGAAGGEVEPAEAQSTLGGHQGTHPLGVDPDHGLALDLRGRGPGGGRALGPGQVPRRLGRELVEAGVHRRDDGLLGAHRARGLVRRGHRNILVTPSAGCRRDARVRGGAGTRVGCMDHQRIAVWLGGSPASGAGPTVWHSVAHAADAGGHPRAERVGHDRRRHRRGARGPCPRCDILVVDDGSVDGTAERRAPCGRRRWCQLPFNVGVGGAMRTAFLYAQRNDYDAVVQVDADGQHVPDAHPRPARRPGRRLGGGRAPGSPATGTTPCAGRAAGPCATLATVADPRLPCRPHGHDVGLPGRRPSRHLPVRPPLPRRVPRRHGRVAGHRRARRVAGDPGPGRDACPARAARPASRRSAPRSTSGGPCSRSTCPDSPAGARSPDPRARSESP